MKSKPQHSFLFVPGTKSEGFWSKVLHGHFEDNLPANVIFDLEDSVPDHLKHHARELLTKIFASQIEVMSDRFGVFVRINSANSPFFKDDLDWFAQFLNFRIGIFLAKCSSASDLQHLVIFLQNTLNPVIPLIETLNGYNNRGEICHLVKSADYSYVSFGAGDMSLDMNIERDYNLTILKHIMMELVITAKRYGLAIIDSPARILPKPGNDWEKELEAECRWSSMNGFDAKFAVHPAQVNIIEKAFGSKFDVARTTQIVKEFAKHPDCNSIRNSLTGDYIGLPVMKQVLNQMNKT